MSNETTETTTETVEQGAPVTTDWKSTLPEDIRSDASLTNIPDVVTLAKSYTSAQRMLGGRVPIPSKDASDEVRAEFYSKLETIPGIVSIPSEEDAQATEKMTKVYDKLGRPSTADKYQLEFPEGLNVNTDYVDNIKKAAHEAGLNNKQLAKLAEVQIAHETKLAEFVTERKTNTEAFLKKQWGNAYSDYKQLVNNVLSKYETKFPDAVKEIRESTLGDNPIVSLLAAELGKAYSETGAIEPNMAGRPGLTPDDARYKISEISSNRQHAYHNHADPGHDEAVKLMNRLYAAAYPDPENK